MNTYLRFWRLPATLSCVLLTGCCVCPRAPESEPRAFESSRPEQAEPVMVPPEPPEPVVLSYVVKRGDTLSKIALALGVRLDALIQANEISNPNLVRVGQILKYSPAAAPVAQTAEALLVESPQALATSATPRTLPRAAPPPRARDADLNSWAWPANGAVMQAFTPTTKGIDLAGSLGDPVIAAADGKVKYAGNGVRGLGNLVLIEHAGGFLSAYAHNSRMLVSKDQLVKRGTKIAEIGQTDTTSPRLHFEVRRQDAPVNPLLYLPPR